MVQWIVAKAVLGLKTAILAGLGFVTSDEFPLQVASIAGLSPAGPAACEFRYVVHSIGEIDRIGAATARTISRTTRFASSIPPSPSASIESRLVWMRRDAAPKT